MLLLTTGVVLSYAQSPRRTAESAERIVALDPRWAVSFETAAAAPAGFDQEAAYVPLKGGELVAVDLSDGEVRWRVEMETAFTPATGDGLVFAGAERLVMALDQRSGRTVWRTPLPGDLSGPLYWESGWVTASTAAGDLLAIRAEDGRVLWQNSLGAPLAVRPSLAGERMFVALQGGRVVALHVETGQVQWSLSLAEEPTGILAMEEQVLVGTRANHLHSLSPDRGRRRWRQRTGADVVGAPVADNEFIYIVSFDNVLRALSRGNGNLRWSRNLPSRPTGGVLRAEDVVLVPLSTGTIGAYLATTGAPSFTIQVSGEMGGAPFLREARPTAPRLVAMSRDGSLEGFAARFEEPPVPLADLPGVKVGG